MLRAWPSIPAALALGAVLHILIAAVRPPARVLEDPWLHAWQRAGIRSRFRSDSEHPERNLLSRKLREAFKKEDLLSARLRLYDIEGIRAQVVSLPPNTALPREDDPGDRFEWITCGRHGLLLEKRRHFMGLTTALPLERRKTIIAAFEKATATLP